MSSNRGVVYLGPGKVDVQRIDFPTFRNPAGKKIDHESHTKGRRDEYLWFGPTYGARPDHGTDRDGLGS